MLRHSSKQGSTKEWQEWHGRAVRSAGHRTLRSALRRAAAASVGLCGCYKSRVVGGGVLSKPPGAYHFAAQTQGP